MSTLRTLGKLQQNVGNRRSIHSFRVTRLPLVTRDAMQWDVFTVRFYSRGIPFPGSHCGANRPSVSSAVHSFQSCRGRRASFLGQKNSSKSISNLIEALVTRPEGWTCSILKEPCVIVWTDLERISSPGPFSSCRISPSGFRSPRENFFGVTFRSISAVDLLIYDFSVFVVLTIYTPNAAARFH